MATEKYPYDPETGSIPLYARWDDKWKVNEPFYAELKFVSYSGYTRFLVENVETGARYHMSPTDMFATASQMEIRNGTVYGLWEAVIRGGRYFSIRPVIKKR